MTPTKAQAFLASQLPERVQIMHWTSRPEVREIIWQSGWQVKETEWDYIARQVESKLPYEKLVDYERKLWALWIGTLDDEYVPEIYFRIWLIKLDYLTRATALKEVLEIESK
jgi:hypothetical protein